MDYSREPKHSEKLIVRGIKPFNAEPHVAQLVKHKLTPEELVYCRNHSPVVTLDPATFTLTVGGDVKHPLTFTLAQLKREFPREEVVAALQCAGNRRATMAKRTGRDVEGIKWEEATIANCRWGGARLRDVLSRAGARGLDDPATCQSMHVCFASHVSETQDDSWYGASIELAKAASMDGEVLIAYDMNGQPISADRGAPFRVIVPGYTGARWVKWVDTITVCARPSENYYQTKDYKLLPATVQTRAQSNSEGWWARLPAMQSNILNSVVATVEDLPMPDGTGDLDMPTNVRVKGYAIGGAVGGQVTNIDVSVDRGATWMPARITYREGKWSWVLWEADLPLWTHGKEKLCERSAWSRATDESGATQAQDTDWNLRGLGFGGFGQMRF